MSFHNFARAALASGALLVACADSDPLLLESATPNQGPTEGGTEVMLKGRWLSPFSTVTFGTNPAPEVRWIDWSTMAVTSPPGEVGTVDIAVTHFVDRSVLNAAFTYTEETPVVPEDCVVTITPGFGADDVDVTASLTVAFSEPVDPDTAAASIRLTRLGDDVPILFDVDVVDDSTLSLRPRGSLSFFASYEIWVDEVLTTAASGASCPADQTVFSTRSPFAAPRPLRPAPVNGFAVIGDVGIAASATYRGLQVYDLSDPSAPVVTDEVVTEQTPLGIQIEGDRAYVPTGATGVLIFDISVPDSPEEIGVAGTPGSALDVVPFTRGAKRYLAVADGPGGLRFIDVTQSEGAKDVKVVFPAGNPATYVSSIDMRGNLVAVAEPGTGTFALIDATSLTAPVVLASRTTEAVAGTFSTSMAAWDVALGNGNLYVGLLSYGIEAFDIVDPATPTFIDHILGPQGVCASGCPDAIGSMVVVDNTTSTEKLYSSSVMTGTVRTALVAGALQSEVLPAPGRVHSVLPTSGHVWVGTERGLAVFETSAADGAAPIYAESGGWGVAWDAISVNGALYASSSSRGLETYDLSSPQSPSLLEVAATAGAEADVGLVSVHAVDDLLLVGDGRAGLAIFDASNAAHPQLISELFPQADTVADMVTSDESAYVCDGNRPFWVLGFADPLNVTKQEFPIPPEVYGCHSLALLGDALYLAGPYGLAIYDVSIESTPVLVDTLALPAVDVLLGLAVRGEHLYATTYASDYEGTNGAAQRLVVFDVSDPFNPLRVFKGPDIGGVGEIEVHGDKLFLGGGREGVWVYGLADPAVPQFEGRIDFPGVVSNMTITAIEDTSILYVAQRGGGVGASVIGRVLLDE